MAIVLAGDEGRWPYRIRKALKCPLSLRTFPVVEFSGSWFCSEYFIPDLRGLRGYSKKHLEAKR